MASGDTLAYFLPHELVYSPFGLSKATLKRRSGMLVLEYADTAFNAAHWVGVMPKHYTGGTITASILWISNSATTGNVLWLGRFRRLVDGTDDVTLATGAGGFDSQNAWSAAGAPGTSGIVDVASKSFSVADLDDIAGGDFFAFLVVRDGTGGGDTMADAAQVIAIKLEED